MLANVKHDSELPNPISYHRTRAERATRTMTFANAVGNICTHKIDMESSIQATEKNGNGFAPKATE